MESSTVRANRNCTEIRGAGRHADAGIVRAGHPGLVEEAFLPSSPCELLPGGRDLALDRLQTAGTVTVQNMASKKTNRHDWLRRSDTLLSDILLPEGPNMP